jgi:hypothetical protein
MILQVAEHSFLSVRQYAADTNRRHLSSHAALLDIFETVRRGHFWQNERQ